MPDSKNDTEKILRKKGGAVFPRINLEKAVEYAKKLVSKTHVSPQAYSTNFPGVFNVGANSPQGQIRASALKQYGLMEGKKEFYDATQLAKTISMSEPDDIVEHLKKAVLKPKIFSKLYDIFHGDETSLAKLSKQAHSLGVHPDVAENCAEIFIDSTIFAKLGNLDGELLTLSSSTLKNISEEASENNSNLASEQGEGDQVSKYLGDNEAESGLEILAEQPPLPARSAIHVNVTLDSSLDTDKLERQLALLRKYGAI